MTTLDTEKKKRLKVILIVMGAIIGVAIIIATFGFNNKTKLIPQLQASAPDIDLSFPTPTKDRIKQNTFESKLEMYENLKTVNYDDEEKIKEAYQLWLRYQYDGVDSLTFQQFKRKARNYDFLDKVESYAYEAKEQEVQDTVKNEFERLQAEQKEYSNLEKRSQRVAVQQIKTNPNKGRAVKTIARTAQHEERTTNKPVEIVSATAEPTQNIFDALSPLSEKIVYAEDISGIDTIIPKLTKSSSIFYVDNTQSESPAIIKAVVYGRQKLYQGDFIKIRFDQDVLIEGRVLENNTIIKGQVSFANSRMLVKFYNININNTIIPFPYKAFDIDGMEGLAVNEDYNRKIAKRRAQDITTREVTNALTSAWDEKAAFAAAGVEIASTLAGRYDPVNVTVEDGYKLLLTFIQK